MLALLPWTLLSMSSLGIFLLASDALMLLHCWLIRAYWVMRCWRDYVMESSSSVDIVKFQNGFASLIPAHLKEKRPLNRCLFTSTVWCPWFVCGLVDASTTLLSLFSGVICYPKPQTNSAHTHPFNGPFSVTTQVSRYQKGKTSLDFAEARDSEWQWHQLGHMQICISLQTDNHASTPPLKFFYRPDALPAAQPTASKHWRP